MSAEAEQSQEPVAFTASARDHQRLSTSTMVKFENVLINVGNHYDPGSSQFTSPTTALYFVSAKVDGNNKATIQLEVLNAGSRIFFLWAGSYSAYPSVSGSAITECQAGNKIWVQSIGSGQIFAQTGSNIFSVLMVTKTS